jgi:hypothetical protein
MGGVIHREWVRRHLMFQGMCCIAAEVMLVCSWSQSESEVGVYHSVSRPH